MGVIKQGILGGFSGRVAGVVGSSWKGIAVIKSRPLSVSNPKTAAQTAQRTKFSAVVAFAKLILTTIVKPCWDRFAQLKSGYNAFIQANIDAYSDAGVPTYADLVISEGSLVGGEGVNISSSNGSSSVTVNWEGAPFSGNALATDEAYVLVINETQDNIGVSSAEVTRNDEGATFDMETACVTGDTLHAYLAFRRADGTLVSNTVYVTDDVPA